MAKKLGHHFWMFPYLSGTVFWPEWQHFSRPDQKVSVIFGLLLLQFNRILGSVVDEVIRRKSYDFRQTTLGPLNCNPNFVGFP